jgi:hypothetical protein
VNDQLQLLLTEFRAFRDTEWREFRESVASWQQDTGERIAQLETHVKSGITGNGQPSRLQVASATRKRMRIQHENWLRSRFHRRAESRLAN